MYKSKEDVLMDYPELELTDFGDFKIKNEYVKDYEIIDFHCHMFEGLKELFPNLLKNEKDDMSASFFDESCFPFSLKLFDMNKIAFTNYPKNSVSVDGIKGKVKLITGGFVMRKATTKRLLRDMKLNNISKSLIMQINPPNKSVGKDMNKIISDNKELITFGAIHPKSNNIKEKIKEYLSFNIKGWKINPHVSSFKINDKSTIDLLKMLSDTKLPILSCSGIVLPENEIESSILSSKQKKEQKMQRISDFYQVLKQIPNTTFIFAHSAMYEIDDLINLMKEFPNTYTDISTQPSQNIKRLIDSLGSERLLFGTDYPFFNHALSIVSVLRATSNDKERRNIFSLNARRILNI